jgi:REP element-mobilizing transposase RayT
VPAANSMTSSVDKHRNPPEEPELTISRRRLPHWSYEGSVYFLTWRLSQKQSELSAEERDMVAQALRHFESERYQLFCYVIMNDHVHVLVRILESDSPSKTIHTWKSYTANRMQRLFNRKGTIWQDEYFDRIIRNEKEFYDTANYIVRNPLKRWGTEEYKWIWFRSPEVSCDRLVAGTEARPPQREGSHIKKTSQNKEASPNKKASPKQKGLPK